MARCDMCGNDYDKAFTVRKDGRESTFDSFECAIHMLAPQCGHCGCRIIGHGIEAGAKMFCCAHCAKESGAKGVARPRLIHLTGESTNSLCPNKTQSAAAA